MKEEKSYNDDFRFVDENIETEQLYFESIEFFINPITKEKEYISHWRNLKNKCSSGSVQFKWTNSDETFIVKSSCIEGLCYCSNKLKKVSIIIY